MTERPELDEDANKELEGTVWKFKSRVLNTAEKKVLDDGRPQILKSDIFNAQKKIWKNGKDENGKDKKGRKTLIRLLFAVVSTLLSIQLTAIYGINSFINFQVLGLVYYIVILFAVLIVFTLVVITAIVFRDDWR